MKKFLSLFIIFILFHFSCSKKEKLPTLTVGHVGHDHQIALGVAAIEGEKMKGICGVYLKEEKPREVYILMEEEKPLARIFIKKVGGGARMPASMERGEIEVGLGGIPAVIFYIDKGNKFKILSPLNVDGDMLLVRNGFGANSWNGFVKKVKEAKKPIKVGYKAPVAVQKLIFVKACQSVGIKCVASGKGAGPHEIELVNLQGASNIIPGLKSGSVDAAVINEPVGSNAVYKKAAKIISLLSELPPKGEWKSHPCCCVCATEKAIKEKKHIIKAFMRLIVAATEIINKDKQKAAEMASKWTKMNLEVERMSIPNIVYKVKPDKEYKDGLFKWFNMMKELGKFKGRLKNLTNEEAYDLVHDFSVINEIIK